MAPGLPGETGSSHRGIIGGSVLAVLALGILDYLTGPDIAFSILYLLPIALAAWRAGRRAGLAIGALAGLAWAAADALTRTTPYRHLLVPVWNSGARLATFVLVVWLVSELHERMRAQTRLARLDPLTGVTNWRTFVAAAEHAIGRARRDGGTITLAYVDVDDFKHVNDTRGHAGGDAVLHAIAERLQRNIRVGDILARVGGDEFVLLLTDIEPAMVGEVLSQMTHRTSDEAGGIDVGLSIGAVTETRPERDLDSLLRSADDLMYEVKRSGKGGVRHQFVT
ncbi:MAG: diguanylate cyclase [Chloroflexota bacterium]|nr:diguanylate cyclase [Chloroflexota bacterium]